MSLDKCCATCIYFNPMTYTVGLCEYPLPDWLHNFLQQLNSNGHTVSKIGGGGEKDGYTCPCWQAKPEAKAKESIGCPVCKMPLMDAPGIGLYCPNKDCEVSDAPDLYGEVSDAQ